MPAQELTQSIHEQSVFQNAVAPDGADARWRTGAAARPERPAIGPSAASTLHAATDLHEECAAVGAGVVAEEGWLDGSIL